jgi:hypothetical protein
MHAMLGQEWCIEKHLANSSIAIIPSALPDILHIATLEDALDHEAGLRVVVDLVEVHIPEDAAGEDGLIGAGHGAKLGARLPCLRLASVHRWTSK